MGERNFVFHPINHVGVSVPDIEAAVEWYVKVLGFHQLRPPRTIDRKESPDAGIFKIYPQDLNKVTVCPLSSGNGVGLELFQFYDPEVPEQQSNFASNYKRGGLFHIAITTPDVGKVCDEIIMAGGKKLGQTITVYEYEATYVEDPWGNTIELLSASFERIMSNRD